MTSQPHPSDSTWFYCALNVGTAILLASATAAVLFRNHRFSVGALLASTPVLAAVSVTGDRDWGGWNLLLAPLGLGAVSLLIETTYRLKDYHDWHPPPRALPRDD